MFLIIIDAHSKWIEIFKTSGSDSTTTINCLRSTFARLGLPNTVVSDNGPSFISLDFESFLRSNGVCHVTSTPYHPQSNRLAERMVQTFKSSMKKQKDGSVDLQLAQFLISYRNTPQTTTGETPAEMMFGRQLRTRLDLIHPDMENDIRKKQQKQKEQFDKNTQRKKVGVDDRVHVRNYKRGSSSRWIAGLITSRIGNTTLTVSNGACFKRHVNQVRFKEHSRRVPELEVTLSTRANQEQTGTDSSVGGSTVLRRSTRSRHPPQRYAEENWS